LSEEVSVKHEQSCPLENKCDGVACPVCNARVQQENMDILRKLRGLDAEAKVRERGFAGLDLDDSDIVDTDDADFGW
jgi:hypothetical protein